MAANVLNLSTPIKVGALASDPATADNGTIYFNTSTSKLRMFQGGTWSDLSAAQIADNVFRIVNNTDPTKQIAFSASAIATGTTRTITMPNADVDLGKVATALQTSQLGTSNGVASLDANGQIPSAQLPPLAITSTQVVATIAARDALTNTQEGDVVIVTATGLTYIKDNGGVYQTISAAGSVTSVNGFTGTVNLNTDNISEGITNKYHTAARAQADVVLDQVTGSQTTQAPSVNAVKTALAAKLSSVSQDTAPSLGGNLNLNGKEVTGLFLRDGNSGAGNFIEQEYIHAVTLSASQSAALLSSLSFSNTIYDGLEITYKIKEATTGRIRIGTLKVVTDGTNTSLTDAFNETADVGVTWTAVMNTTTCEIHYTTTANAKTMRADVKRFKI